MNTVRINWLEDQTQTGWVYWEGTLNFNANTCFTQELGL